MSLTVQSLRLQRNIKTHSLAFGLLNMLSLLYYLFIGRIPKLPVNDLNCAAHSLPCWHTLLVPYNWDFGPIGVELWIRLSWKLRRRDVIGLRASGDPSLPQQDRMTFNFTSHFALTLHHMTSEF